VTAAAGDVGAVAFESVETLEGGLADDTFILGPDGSPMDGVTLAFRTATYNRNTRTNAEGQFTLNVPAGTYTITATDKRWRKIEPAFDATISGETEGLIFNATEVVTGARLKSVPAESNAGKAGLIEGDVIVKYGSTDITYTGNLTMAIRNLQNSTEPIEVEYIRSGARMTTQVEPGTLGQLAAFLFHLTDGSGLSVRDLRLSIPRAADASSLWDAEATLTYLIYAPSTAARPALR